MRDQDSSDSSHSQESIRIPTVVNSKNGVESRGIPEDISEEIRTEIRSTVFPDQETRDPVPSAPTSPRRVRFDDIPVIIEQAKASPEYDIIQDIKDQKANVTIGQLLQDSSSYQKLIRDIWTQRRKRRIKLPSVAVNFTRMEDHGAPELTVEVEGCTIPKVLVDGGSGVNLMLEDTAFDLGFTTFEKTEQVLRMADQSRVVPVGKLSQVPTRIGEVTYLLNFVIIRVGTGRPFPMLLGRPWLYTARVLVDWGRKEFVIGKPSVRIPWKVEAHMGETCESDGYTTDWSDLEDSSVASYLVTKFDKLTEVDFEFPDPCQDLAEQDGSESPPATTNQVEDRSLGEGNVPLTQDWIWSQIQEGKLDSVGLRSNSPTVP